MHMLCLIGKINYFPMYFNASNSLDCWKHFLSFVFFSFREEMEMQVISCTKMNGKAKLHCGLKILYGQV